ncbi:protein TIS11 isoform X3 [Halyomorpha halys]|uniref:protein TIS11 isoform X3 n=1 Tax=Halyomorpha halys TaxID=286706 RepID=UPI0006D516B4|nr:protein TIS11 isoform X3 [Halyomorpha halys]
MIVINSCRGTKFSEIQVDRQLMNPVSLQSVYALWKSVVEQQQPADSKPSWESLDSDASRPLPLSLMTTFLLENIGQSHRKLERTQSETVTVKPSPPIAVNTSRYKTELCRPYEESGTCKYGEKCQFAHGGHELRCLVRHPKYKTELCRTFHSVGFCPYGPRCHFIHNAEEARSGLSPRPSSSPTSSLASSPGYFSSPPHSPPPSPASPERLPVFNRISNTLLPMRFGSELIA